MSSPISKAIVDPSFSDSMTNLKQDIFRSMNCIKVGVIQSFDITKATAQIQILFKRVLSDGTIQSYPVLVDCPIVTVQGGGAYLQMPITKGDNCLLFFSDRNIDAWYKTGSENAPFDLRCHDLSDGIAIVGLNSLISSIPDYSTTEMRITFGGAKIAESGGKVTIQNATTSLLTVIDGLIDVVKALTVGGFPIDAGGLTALEAYKATIATLLY